MKQLPDVAKSRQAVSSGSRVRRWVARLSLFVACAGSVATSPPSSPFFQTTAEYEGPPLRVLSPEQPKLTRTLVASASVEEALAAYADGALTAVLAVTWKPTNPLDQATPTLRLRLRSQDYPSNTNEVPDDFVIEQPRQQVSVSSDPFGCALDAACERRFHLTLEILPKSAQGALEVEWKVVGEAHTDHEPKGFKLHITEP